MSAFEIISADEFKSAQTAQFEKASPPAEGRSVPPAVGTPLSDGTGGEGNFPTVYCKFCKGYYIAEYHVTRGGDNS